MKLYPIPSSSFGRLLSEALIVDQFVSETNSKLLAFTQEKTCNAFVLESLAQDFIIWNSPILRKLYNFMFRNNLRYFLLDQDRVFTEQAFFFNLMKAQRKNRERFLTSSYIDELPDLTLLKSRPVVLFSARTDTYWNSQNGTIESDLNLRNSNNDWIETVVGMLIDSDFSVIRIGTEQNAALSIRSEFFFDYSLSKFRSEKSDFGICHHADFAVTTGGGISLLPSLMGIPSLMVNTGLFSDLQPQEYLSHYLPKSVYSISEDKPLSMHALSKLELRSMQKDSDYLLRGLEIRDVTPEDTLVAIKHFFEMLERNGFFDSSDGAENDNFHQMPQFLREHFPADIRLPDSEIVVGIKVHRLWKNFQNN